MLKDYFDDLISLFYPRICLACGNTLYKNEHMLCFSCHYHLPKTNFHLQEDNAVARQFWGKINFSSAASFYYFSKGSKVQHLVHQFKYKGYKEIGSHIGKLYGIELNKSPLFSTISVVIPVPLHPKKEAIRGYNQAEWFAMGLAESMKVTLDITTLLRVHSSETQTRKTRFKRWENVKEIFLLNNPEQLAGKHILLVDDVITTGSTLEAAGHELMKIPDVKISVASIACAVR